jgi:hypothetical protein
LVFVGRPWYRWLAQSPHLHKPGDNICAARTFLLTSVGCMRVSRHLCAPVDVHTFEALIASMHTSVRHCISTLTLHHAPCLQSHNSVVRSAQVRADAFHLTVRQAATPPKYVTFSVCLFRLYRVPALCDSAWTSRSGSSYLYERSHATHARVTPPPFPRLLTRAPYPALPLYSLPPLPPTHQCGFECQGEGCATGCTGNVVCSAILFVPPHAALHHELGAQ